MHKTQQKGLEAPGANSVIHLNIAQQFSHLAPNTSCLRNRIAMEAGALALQEFEMIQDRHDSRVCELRFQ